mmetsp:Transcript_2324/g.4989  ORF Transcript_2324/g.4989 Transcript_2324/m.4989 type:complete len:333 (+) Transcript_2324:146-1144(+)|eukprot:CAMPEP_0168164230 /NCGR_PEP_ID=MMETSP0139_2-20121125/824_1 /TAXON_ID=44445 /ORGANISM="Pseudo-nitzschia australis, Strain 10249 10 AB" /LENGTH=332 /DNA_ID=CAMNT_0008081229 /DNA_START=72 /DNA_END=1070 /DNA_ORIENTATION=-
MGGHIIQIDPESELVFTLSPNEATPRCMMTLRHGGGTNEYIAFKVKTTQPRRYLVRPNQGLIAPGTSETISILLVEKDKQVLLQAFDRLGQSGLDHSKDKFLVQSCTADSSLAAKKVGNQSELYDALTSMWNSNTAARGASSADLQHKKLHVRHIVDSSPSGAGTTTNTSKSTGAAPKLESTTHSNLTDMSADQISSELANLRRKYDELVSFSVNLTAERDILSNTLEQTKRDYNREMAARSALENKQGVKSASGSSSGEGNGKSMLSSLMQLIVIGLACFLSGARIGASGNAPHLPVVGNFFVENNTPIIGAPIAEVPIVEAGENEEEEEL